MLNLFQFQICIKQLIFCWICSNFKSYKKYVFSWICSNYNRYKKVCILLNLFQAKRRGRGKGWCPRGSTRRGRIRLSRLERQRPGLYLTIFCNNRSKKLDRFIFGHIFFQIRTTVMLFGTLAIEHTPILRLPFEKAWPFDRLLSILSIRTWWLQNPKKMS